MASQSRDNDAPKPPGARRVFRRARAMIGRNHTADRVYRVGVGVAGTGTVLLGIALIPLPGPGSLIALGGLALLGTEFEGAKKTRTALNMAASRAWATMKARRSTKG